MKVSSQEIYNENMALIRTAFGDEVMLPFLEVAKFLGCDPRTLEYDKDFPLKRIGALRVVCRTSLAAWMARN